jgi:hypothetical protein
MFFHLRYNMKIVTYIFQRLLVCPSENTEMNHEKDLSARRDAHFDLLFLTSSRFR